MQTGAKGGGCHKCGKPGHWARDCTAPQGEWLSRTGSAPPALPGSQRAAGPNAATRDGVPPDPTPAPIRKRKRQKPKLTPELLLRETDGLPIVYLTFAERFREQYKGKGHEGSSLRRLLQMYERWQHRLIPSMQFDDFLAAAEKIGNTMEWKKEMRHLRMEAIKLPKDAREEEHGASDPAGPPPGAGTAAQEAGRPPESAGLAIDDDELLQMQAANQEQNGSGTPEDEEDLFDLLEDAQESHGLAGAPPEAMDDAATVDGLFADLEAAKELPRQPV